MRQSPIWLSLVAAGATVLLSLSALLDLYRVTAAYNAQNPDPFRIGYQEPRFREAASQLPLSEPVGYVSNLEFSELRGSAAFFGAQYALAPRILVPYEHPRAGRFTIGNFSAEVDLADVTSRLAREKGLRVIRAFDNGVVLFRTPERR
jgi:hypothetical protein